MINEEKLFKRSSDFTKQDRKIYLTELKEFLTIKKDIENIKEDISSFDILEDLKNNSKIMDMNTTSIDVKKQLMIDNIRLYIQFMKSNIKDDFEIELNKLLDDNLIGYIYPKLINILRFDGGGNYNQTIGLLKSYYDITKMISEVMYNNGIIDCPEFWAYENLEFSTFNDIENLSANDLLKLVKSAKKVYCSYIVVLYSLSRVLYELSFLKERIESLNLILDSGELLPIVIEKFTEEIKKGNSIIAFANSIVDERNNLMNEINSFNQILLNINRG